MKGIFTLPAGYAPLLSINLQKNKWLAILLNLLGLVIMAVMAVIGAFFVPVSAFFDTWLTEHGNMLRVTVLLVGYVVYIALHELVHGVFIRIFSGKRAKYGFTGMYAYAGSDAYFTKIPYLVIALAPVVIWGAVLAVLCALVPPAWFWPIYFIQIGNVAGAVGDFYVTVRFCRLPRDILVKDCGVGMTVFSKEGTGSDGQV